MLVALGLFITIIAAGLWLRGLARRRATEADYRAFSPLARSLRHARRRPAFWLLAIAPSIAAIATGTGWEALGPAATGVRLVAFIIAAVLAWAYATAERNYVLDQSHILERSALIALAASLWWHPAGLAPFLLVLHLVVGQFDRIRGMFYTRTPLRLPVDLLALIAVGAPLVMAGWVPPASLPLALLVVQGAHYFAAGLAKLRLAEGCTWWLRRNQLANLFMNGHVQGWLPWLSAERAARVFRAMRLLTLPLAAGTLLVEFGAVLAPLHPAVAIACGLACIALHAGIYFSSSINFYKWAVADAALVLMVVLLGPSGGTGVFGLPAMLAAMAALPLALWLFAPVRLGWSDTRLCVFFKYQAIGVSGKVYDVPVTFFAPFDVIFAQNRFYFLRRRPHLVDTFGCNTRRDDAANGLAAAIDATCGDGEKMAALCRDRGLKKFDPRASEELERVVRACFAAKRPEPAWLRVLGRLRAPKHIALGVFGERYRFQEPVREVVIRAIETYAMPDGSIRTVHDEIVRRIALAPAEAKSLAA